MGTDRIDDQHKGYISSREACKQLKVKAATLYSYVSRGLVSCVHLGGRKKLYSQEDISRLLTRSAANKGHTAAAASALRWGEPVLDSAITKVEEGKIFYRGQDLHALLSQKKSFEEIAQLLLARASPLPGWVGSVRPREEIAPIHRLLTFASKAQTEGKELSAQEWLSGFASLLGAEFVEGRSLSEALCVGYQLPLSCARAIEIILIVCADHELNVSTFTARVVASSGASTAACLLAALCAFTGAKHGGVTTQLEERALCLGRSANEEKNKQLEVWMNSKETMPGFGHRLYQHRDPRTAPLLQAARALQSNASEYLALLQWIEAAEEAGHVPTVDIGIVAVTAALGLPAGSAAALFALGRTVGWLAHIEEQRQQPILLRPRARYTGP